MARAAGLFATTRFWRDPTAFIWSITAVENPDGIADPLAETLERAHPTGFTVEEPPDR
ncbi:putative flavoprotein involved in K+ transport [Blastococcus fimeti]|nr:putative flavoprotein involved in K+ transport [Blastococcus fimeti]